MRATTRQAAYAYFQAQHWQFVGTVYAARPMIIDENDYDANMLGEAFEQLAGDTMSSCVVVINIPDSQRERQTLSGRNFVDDTDIHDFVLEVYFANRGGDAIQAQADHDVVMDEIVKSIRADPTLGTSGQGIANPSVWSAGEFRSGVHVQQGRPFTNEDGPTIFVIATVRFQAWEWLSGPAGTT